MKYRNLKLFFPVLSFVLGIGLTSCVNDLDVTPIDPSVTQTFNQDGEFAKLYASLALTGQNGPAGNGDVAGIDEGTSDFVRLIWNLNEMSTDEAICSWGDPGIPELNFNKWTSSHNQITGFYGRLYFGITISNHFLKEIEGKTDEKSVKQRAEARFLRALNYYYLLDMFGNVPFSEVVSLDPPKQIKRADLYTWIEKELTECETDMYAPLGAPAYRVDKVANWMLRMRLYLNAEVYTGTAQWNKAAEYAYKVIKSGYALCPTYKQLFMADNDGSGTVNKAKQEIIYSIAADGINTRNWGSSLFLIASTHTSGMNEWGSSEGWGGNRARSALVKKFFPGGNIPGGANMKDLTTAAGDDRAMFFGDDRKLEITTITTFKEGYSVAKFSNVRADGAASHDKQFVDMDVPFMRMAEAYLAYAEAVTRGGAKQESYDALTAFNAIRSRSHAPTALSITLPTIMDEWCKEFFFEGRRRTDLIRFNSYGGSDYSWDWKGGVATGAKFSATMNIFPIPATDMNANPNLVQNPGY